MPLPEALVSALSDRYRLERELGAGGMAIVWLARDLKHDRPVALKVLRPELALVVGADRFLREIRITARLSHPHILPLIDSGDAGGFLYYVAPYIDGESLRDRLEREPRLPVAEATRIAREIAEALAAAHEAGVVHRDIKPENILLSRGQAIVADFGIGRALLGQEGPRLTETGLAIGTPAYMSPEQAMGERTVDHRTDIYALGCLLYEMLTGRPPHAGANAQAVLARRLTEPVSKVRGLRADVPPSLAQAVERALERDPDARFATMAAFAAALASPVDGGGAARGSRPRWLLAALAGVAVAAAAFAAARLAPRRAAPAATAARSHVLVLPFTPSGADTALVRLGRDLVFTLSAELDGLGDIRVVDAHTVLAQGAEGTVPDADQAAALAARFGAGSLLRGSLVREGARVRADFSLLDPGGAGEPLARGSVSAPMDSVAALTDSTVHLLLAQVWTAGAAPTPSLGAALRTHSAAALRAFLQGEQLLVGGRWDDAVAAYTRAHEADGEFALAAAREAYAIQWSLREPEPGLIADLRRHLAALPEAERLATEAIIFKAEGRVDQALERTGALAERFPDSWFGWLLHADGLMHDGPLLGHAPAEAQAGFERALALNPNLIPVHEHLFLLAIRSRDTADARRAYEELDRLGAGPSMSADGFGNRMLQFRFLLAIARGDAAGEQRMLDSIVRDPTPATQRFGSSFYDPYRHGFHRAQLRESARAAELEWPAGKRYLRSLAARAWVGLGAWDSALALTERPAPGFDAAVAARDAYRLAVLGTWLGALDRTAAETRSVAAARAAGTPEARAEVAWLDGVRALARRDRAAVATARRAIAATGATGAAVLDRSLAAFDQALRGDSAAAGAALAALEWEEAGRLAPDLAPYPLAIVVHRIAAARWLAAAGDTDQARRLLVWTDGAFVIHPSTQYSLMLAGVIARERERIEAGGSARRRVGAGRLLGRRTTLAGASACEGSCRTPKRERSAEAG